MTRAHDDDDDDALIPDDVEEEIAEDMREVRAIQKDIEELEDQAEQLEAERERRRRIFASERQSGADDGSHEESREEETAPHSTADTDAEGADQA